MCYNLGEMSTRSHSATPRVQTLLERHASLALLSQAKALAQTEALLQVFQKQVISLQTEVGVLKTELAAEKSGRTREVSVLELQVAEQQRQLKSKEASQQLLKEALKAASALAKEGILRFEQDRASRPAPTRPVGFGPGHPLHAYMTTMNSLESLFIQIEATTCPSTYTKHQK